MNSENFLDDNHKNRLMHNSIPYQNLFNLGDVGDLYEGPNMSCIPINKSC